MTSIQIDRTDGLSSSTAIKGPVKAASTTNISLTGEQTIDGVALVTGDRVLVMGQTSAVDNGIWKVSTGVWSRAKDFSSNRDVRQGTAILVAGGTANSGIWEVTTSDPIAIGSTSLAFSLAALSPAQIAALYQPLDADLTAIAGLSTQAYGRSLLTMAAAEDVRNSIDAAPYVASRTALKALDTTKETVAILDGSIWFWTAGNFSTQITADTQEGNYAKANAIASSAGAWVRGASVSTSRTSKSYQAVGDGVTDDTVALNKLLSAVQSESVTGRIASGTFKVANASGPALTLDLSGNVAATVSERKRPNILGEGMGVTVIAGATASQYAMKIVGASGIASQIPLTIGDMSFGAGGASTRGLHIYDAAYIRGRDMSFQGINTGLNLESVLSSTFEHLHFYSNAIGMNLTTGAGFSGINAVEFNKCIWALSSANGIAGFNRSTNITFNSCNFEGNGTFGNATTGGVVLTFDALQGHNGANFNDCWFESNTGGFDVQLVNTGTEEMVHVFKGCNFTRSVSSSYVTNNIACYGKNKVILIGCTFDSYNGYTPNSARPYVFDNGATEWICIGCTFGSTVEQGKLFNAGSIWFSNQQADSVRANVATAQTWFDSAQDSCTLEANKTYEFEGMLLMDRSAGVTSHTTSIGLGGTVTASSINWFCDVANPNSGTSGAVTRQRSSALNQPVQTTANTSATEQIEAFIKGTIRTSAAGTLIPAFTYSAAPGGAPTVKAGSYFKVEPRGADTISAAGPWV